MDNHFKRNICNAAMLFEGAGKYCVCDGWMTVRVCECMKGFTKYTKSGKFPSFILILILLR